jgi:hypothetical protein
MGALIFVKDPPTRSAIGFAAALVFCAAYRELSPYASHSVNSLATAATWQIVVVFAGGVVIAGRPFGYSDFVLGSVLLVASLSFLLLTFVMQLVNGSSELELEQEILEAEARETDLQLSLEELLGVVDDLIAKNDLGYDLDKKGRTTLRSLDERMRAENMVTVRRVQNGAVVASNRPFSFLSFSPKDGFNESLYPCWVVEHETLTTLKKLPFHEDALAGGLLDELRPGSREPVSSNSYFISQVCMEAFKNARKHPTHHAI